MVIIIVFRCFSSMRSLLPPFRLESLKAEKVVLQVMKTKLGQKVPVENQFPAKMVNTSDSGNTSALCTCDSAWCNMCYRLHILKIWFAFGWYRACQTPHLGPRLTGSTTYAVERIQLKAAAVTVHLMVPG